MNEAFKVKQLKFLINEFRDQDHLTLLELVYYFSLENLSQKQNFDYQRKVIDIVSDFYIIWKSTQSENLVYKQ